MNAEQELWRKLFFAPENQLSAAVAKYLNLQRKGSIWRLPTINSGEQLWADATQQAKLIESRLNEIEGNTSSDAKCERAILKYYARMLLWLYANEGSLVPGIPKELIYILSKEYPGVSDISTHGTN